MHPRVPVAVRGSAGWQPAAAMPQVAGWELVTSGMGAKICFIGRQPPVLKLPVTLHALGSCRRRSGRLGSQAPACL